MARRLLETSTLHGNQVQTILIVDNDLGFVFWLGQALHQEGYVVFPARAVSDATTLVSECIPAVDLLIINFSLPGAADFVRAVRHARENLKVIALAREGEPSPEYYPVLEAIPPSDVPSNASKLEYLKLVRRLLAPNNTAH